MVQENSQSIRKQVYDLTTEDFEIYPAWEIALDEEDIEGQDEETVRPCVSKPPIDPGAGTFVVKAKFILADGSDRVGYLYVSGIGQTSLDFTQPIIITSEGQIMFWYGLYPSDRKQLEEAYRKLGKESDQVFPLRFKSMVEIQGGPYEGVIEGFYYLMKSSWFSGRKYKVEIIK